MTQSSGYITVPLPKGCVLVLTHAEYLRALRRGKAKRRREQFEKRQQHLDKEDKHAGGITDRGHSTRD